MRYLHSTIKFVIRNSHFDLYYLYSSTNGLVEQTIYKWIKLYSPITDTDEGETVSMKEFKELQKKMAQLEMENEILKKATAIFARKH